MGFFESLFYTIWRGFAIGILISAPMGPVGILCIQRTLDKGRRTGLYTGVGAAISDLFYCILTGFGLSFIEEFLERNQNVIQLVGSVVLIAFAIYLFKKNPASSLKTPEQEASQISPHKNILGGFLFTFSNPLILFLIIGLFARFNFTIPEISFYYYIAGYIAIFFGAILWWQFVTFSVDKLRAHFNLRSMWLINKIIGGIILIFAIVGIVTGITNLASAKSLHWNQGRGYDDFNYGSEIGLLIDNSSDTLKYEYKKLESPSDNFSLRFRSRNLHAHPSKKYYYKNSRGENFSIPDPFWGYFLTLENDTISFLVKPTEKLTEALPERMLKLEVYTRNHKIDEKIIKEANPYEGENLWRIDKSGESLKIYCGDNGLKQVYLYPLNSSGNLKNSRAETGLDTRGITGFGFYAGWGDKVLISDISVDIDEPEIQNPVSGFELENLEEYLTQSQDSMEGYWTIFDRELEESLLKLGGRYILACVKSPGEDFYELIYLEGAETNSKEWHKGDLKGILRPSLFDGIYNVEWWDATKQPLKRDIRAQEGEGNTLLIQFPYQNSSLRLRKLDN